MVSVLFRVKSAEAGDTIQDAAVLTAYSNGTYLTGNTDTNGECRLDLYRSDDNMKVLIAAEGHLPYHTTLVPSESENEVLLELEPSKDGRKGVLFTSSTGYIPGIEGRLNPINDGRYYAYGDNIAINGKLAHPAAHFTLEEPLHLIDSRGVETTIRFLVVEGQFSLIEYTDPKAYG